uniref:Uncharacterized protein n=1 Tax=Acrobeloides nanus TaxID=290746 RepID=A0A914CXR7_9BILA
MSLLEQKTTLSKTTVTRQTAQPEVVVVPSVNSVLTKPSTCPPSSCDTVMEKHHHHEEKGIFDKIKEVFTGGDNPVNKAEKYAKKAGKEVQRECELTAEAEHYADKAAHKAHKYTEKAEKALEKKEEASERAEEYTEKARAEAARIMECHTADLSRQAQELKYDGAKLDEAH